MKKSVIALCGGSLLMLAACTNGYKEKAEQDSIRIAELTSDYNEAATFNDSLMLLMGDIYNGLDSINMQEGLLYNISNGEHDRRAEVRRNLSAIKQRLAKNHELLNQMEQRMKETGNKNTILSRTIEQMQQRLNDQDSHIVLLENQLSAANDSIASLNNQVAQQQMQIQVQTEAKDAAWNAYNEADAQLNTVYYALGTNKELKQNGLLEKKFLGQTKVLKGDVNESYFTKADKRTLKTIPTGAKKIKIWTNMPAGSYEEIKNEDNTVTLKITNPTEFWNYSPYLIIQLD